MKTSISNRPGLSEITYSVGDHRSFFHQMRRLAPELIIDGRRPLAALDTHLDKEGRGDWAPGLMEAWAIVVDILGFYNTRIANEGFLDTAKEDFSIRQLLTSAGFQLNPGVPAHTLLAFEVHAVKGSPSTVAIPAGTAVRQLPQKEELPDTFTTTESANAIAAYNAVPPYRPGVPQPRQFFTDSGLAVIRGVDARLRKNSFVLFTGLVGGKNSVINFFPLEAVTYTTNTTRIDWSPATFSLPRKVEEATFNVFQKNCGLFGRKAPPYTQAPPSRKLENSVVRPMLLTGSIKSDGAIDWQPMAGNFPVVMPTALAKGNEDTLLAAIPGKGILRGKKGNWTPSGAGIIYRDIIVMRQGSHGRIWAGATNGGVYGSSDNGNTWDNVGLAPQIVQKTLETNKNEKTTENDQTLQGANLPRLAIKDILELPDWKFPVPTAKGGTSSAKSSSILSKILSFAGSILPFLGKGAASLVKAIVSLGGLFKKKEHDATGQPAKDKEVKGDVLLVATGSGVFGNLAAGDGWFPFNQGFPNLENASQLARISINALVRVGDILIAATGLGVFVRDPAGKSSASQWQNGSSGLSGSGTPSHIPEILCLMPATISGRETLLAGTSIGLFSATGKPSKTMSWSPVTKGPPEIPVDALHLAGDHILAETSQGLYRSPKSNLDFQPINNLGTLSAQLTGIDANSLPLGGKVPGKLVAALAKQAVKLTPAASFQKGKLPGHWFIEDPPSRYRLVQGRKFLQVYRRVAPKVLPIGEGKLFAAAPAGTYHQTQWPQFYLPSRQIHLEKTVPGIAPGQIVVLQEDKRFHAYQISAVKTAYVHMFGMSRTITSVQVTSDQGLVDFGLRGTTAYVLPRKLPLDIPSTPLSEPISGRRFRLQGRIPEMATDKIVIATGEAAAADFPAFGGYFSLKKPAIEPGLANLDIFTLTRVSESTDSRPFLLAGTSDGVFCITPEGPLALGLQGKTVTSIAIHKTHIYALVHEKVGSVLYALDTIIQDLEKTPGNQGPTRWKPSYPIPTDSHLLEASRQGIIVGTKDGKVLHADQTTIQPLAAKGLPDVPITALLTGTSIMVANALGVFQYNENDLSWTRIGKKGAVCQVTSIAMFEETLYAAATSGVFLLGANQLWQKTITTNVTGQPVYLKTMDNCLWLATRGGGAYVLRGKLWQAVDTGIHNDITCMEQLPKLGFIAAARARVWLTGATAIDKHAIQREHLFDAPAAMARSATFALQLTKAFKKHGITLPSGTAPVTGKHGPGVWRINLSGVSYVLFKETRYAIAEKKKTAVIAVYRDNFNLSILEARAQGTKNTLFTLAGTPSEGTILSLENQILPAPALSDAPKVAEAARVIVSETAIEAPYTSITLFKPLTHVYDRASFALRANVVPAVQGEKVRQVLGSGNSALSFQQFTLARPPLASPKHAERKKMAVDIKVSSHENQPGVSWQQVESLAQQPPGARVYTAGIDVDGQARITFGNGIHGDRLPTSNENILAEYLTGNGTGNLPADVLTQLQQHPLGIKSVTNPLPATGGVAPISPRKGRRVAPVHTRFLDRIVSRSDYADYAVSRPSIRRAKADLVKVADGKLLFITYQPEEGCTVDAQALAREIHKIQAYPYPIQIAHFQPLYFDLTLDFSTEAQDLICEPDQQIRPQLEKLFARLGFGSGLNIHSIENTLRKLQGLTASLLEFYLHGHAPHLERFLFPKPAHFDAQLDEILPAQILTLHKLRFAGLNPASDQSTS